MISTLQIQNGFCQDLLPKALASSDPAATALCNAMLAVSAYHLHGSTSALPYKTKSIAYLSRALSANVEATETQVAASMMLCVYSVFDEAEGNWDVHLDGAKRMLRRWDKLDSDFILTWFLYHEVLGGFTSPSRLDGDETDLMSFVGSSRCDLRMIIGSLGCSLETITIIHKINQLRLRSRNNSHTNISPSTAKERLNLETQLNNLIQTLPPFETSQTPSNQTRTLAIAELYRLASILYLQRVCPMPEDGSNRGFCVRQALNLLNTLEVATSPWPVFVVACESAPSDEYRIAILEVLNRMDQVRGIGNVKVMRGLVESFWKQVDLGRLTKGSWVSWCNAGDGAVAEPWFI